MPYFFTKLLILCFPLIIIVIIKYKGDESMVTPISEIIFSGFVSKIVNNSVDTSWKKIKKVIKNKKTEHQNMESQIYNVIVNALNQVTYNEYEKNQDKIYQAAENLLLGYEKVKSDDIEIVRLGLNILGKKVDNEVYLEFKGMIYNEISKKENVELYHAILLWLLDQKNKYDEIEIEQLNQKLDAVLRILRTKKTEPNLHNSNTYREIKSRTQEYADKWNQNMFLNDFDKRDENAGVNVKLSEVYLEKHLPHYIWGSNRNVSEDLMKLLKEYIYGNNENRMLLILGQPGIGKSTLITWIVANFTDKVDDILVYKFAPDLKNIGWKSNNIFDKILETLKLTYNDLNGKILILDGFDEVNVENGRNKILDKIYWSLNGNLTEKILLIITCRENCIHDLEKIKGQYITLTPWNEKQIESFCFVFREKTYSKISKHTIRNVIRNREILGIPLILYIVLALNISIGENGSIVDIYDRIFSLKENSIYDRCIYEEPHRVSEIKKQIHQVSKDIAIWMFENNSEEASIPQKKFEKICYDIMQKYKNKRKDACEDFLIGNYFKLVKHCEGVETEEVYFVHRSLYEYFVVETIYSSIEKQVKVSRESLASDLGRFLKGNKLSKEMLYYLNLKIRKSKINNEFNMLNGAFRLMLLNGMIYYTNKYYRKEYYKNAIQCEINVFINMLKILHFWRNSFIKFDPNLPKLLYIGFKLIPQIPYKIGV